MMKLSSDKLAEIVGAACRVAPAEVCNVSTDSRNCGREDVFIAIRGEKFDGHDFVRAVIAEGCPLAVVDHLLPDVDPEKQLVVRNTLEAYGQIGAYVRSKFGGIVIGVTGSAGKTTTKEELRFVLSKFGSVYATPGNHNNFVGVPESLCGLDMNADYAVIEMGMSAKGEIARLASYVRPDIAIVTNVYPMHIEFFEQFSGIAEAKAEIFSGLQDGGTAVINADTNFAEILESQAQKFAKRVVKFGRNYQPRAEFSTAAEGEHHLYNAWCVLKIIEILGLNIDKAAACIKDFQALPGRGKKHSLELPSKRGFYTLIDDSYSGQPEAVKLAIQSLDTMETKGRKIAVLGKMAELGKYSEQKHREIGRLAAESKLDVIIGVCPETKTILAQLPDSKEQYYFENKEPLTDFLLNQLLQKDDTLLIKGARYSSKLYQTAEELIRKGTN